MAYCSVEDIKSIIPEQQLVRLTVDNPDIESEIDTAVFEKCTEFSDSLIDGYVRARYTLPLKYVPEFLKQLSKDITAYRLYLRRPQEIPEHIKENYKNAIELLKDIKKGDIELETPAEMPDDSEMSKPKGAYLHKTSKRMFPDDVLNKFI